MYILIVNHYVNENGNNNVYDIIIKCDKLAMLIDFCNKELMDFYDQQESIEKYSHDQEYYKTMLTISNNRIIFGISNVYTIRIINLNNEELGMVLYYIEKFFLEIYTECKNCNYCNNKDNFLSVIR